jgi:hypothetical protein
MAAEPVRLEHLLQLRESVLAEMAEADLEFSTVRMRVERADSDLRIGKPECADYTELKGHLLPQAEARVVDLFRQLLKLEDKINALRAAGLV